MPLLDLLPPAIDLVAHHRRLFDKQRTLWRQRQQRFFRPGHGRKKLPPRKDAHPFRGRQLGSHLRFFVRAFRAALGILREFDPLLIQPSMHCGQQPLGHRRLGQRQQLRFILPTLRPLRLRIKFSYALNLVAEELDAYRPVGLGRVHVQNPASPRKLPRHFHQVHLRIAHRGQVPGQHLHVHLFAALQRHREPGVVVAVKQLQRRRLHRRNQNRDRPSGQLPQRRRPLRLHIGVRG
jgi:hypothetical protein